MGIIHTKTNVLARRVAQEKYQLKFMSDLIKLCVLKMKTGKTWFLVFFSQMFSKIPQSDTCNKFFNVKVKGELHQCVSQKAVSQQCMNLIVVVHI